MMPLAKFWQQDQPLWGCVDCREIYPSGRDTAGAAQRLPRAWSSGITLAHDMPAQGATPGVAATGEERARVEPFAPGALPPPDAIKAELDRYVIGQDDTKRVLAVAMYNHYKRLRIHRGSGGEATGATGDGEGVDRTSGDKIASGNEADALIDLSCSVRAIRAPAPCPRLALTLGRLGRRNSNSTSRTSCCSDRPDRARRSSRARLPASSTYPSPSLTPPASHR